MRTLSIIRDTMWANNFHCEMRRGPIVPADLWPAVILGSVTILSAILATL